MITKDFINKLEAKTFDADFDAAIHEAYKGMTGKNSIYEAVERDYNTAKQILPGALTAEQANSVTRYEQIADRQAHDAAKHGFMAGIVSGEWVFHLASCGFDIKAENVLKRFTMEGKTETNAAAQVRTTECLAIDEELQQELSPEIYEHIVSVTYAWDERIHFVGNFGFYLGYRASLAMIEELHPMSRTALEPLTLAMEHTLGLIKTVEETEK